MAILEKFPVAIDTLFSRLTRNLARAFGLGSLLVAIFALCPMARAQNALSSYSLDGTVTASTGSYDYRYTKHTSSGSGRGGRGHTYYTWDSYLDQTTTAALPMSLGLGQQATTSGTFYGPTYSATAQGKSMLTNTATEAVLTVKYSGATTATTVLGAHQSVTVTAQPGSTFTFTVPAESDVTVSTSGYAGGYFRLFGYGSILLGPLYGTSGPVFLDTPLAPGTYWVDSSLLYMSGVNAQQGTSTNPGKTSTSWSFTMTITPTSTGIGGDGGGN